MFRVSFFVNEFVWIFVKLNDLKSDCVLEPPSDIRVGSNINEELVVDFSPAITSTPVKVLDYYYYLNKEFSEESFFRTTVSRIGRFRIP